MKQFRRSLLDAVVYLVYIFLSCLVVLLVEALLLYVLDKFVLLSYLTQTVIRLVIYSLGVTAMIGVAGYLEGYREAESHPGWTAFSCGLAVLVPQLLLALLFHFRQFCAGAVPFAAGLLRDGKAVTADSILFTEIGQLGLFLGVYVGYGVLYTATLMVCREIGVHRRLRQRREMGLTPDGRERRES